MITGADNQGSFDDLVENDFEFGVGQWVSSWHHRLNEANGRLKFNPRNSLSIWTFRRVVVCHDACSFSGFAFAMGANQGIISLGSVFAQSDPCVITRRSWDTHGKFQRLFGGRCS